MSILKSFGLRILPILSVTALLSTFVLFLSGLGICLQIRRKGGTEGISGAPFLLGFISCAFYVQYGLSKKDNVVLLCNVVGFILQSTYLFYYYAMTRNKRFLNKVIGFEFLAIAMMQYMVRYAGLENGGIEQLGVGCVFLNIATIGAPLLSVGEVIRKKSSDPLPLPLCVASFVVSAQWLWYGIIVEDMVIQMPNYLTTFLSAMQLSLFIIYPRSKVPVRKYSPLPDDQKDY